MGRKKKRAPEPEKVFVDIWYAWAVTSDRRCAECPGAASRCYYCEREFDNEDVLRLILIKLAQAVDASDLFIESTTKVSQRKLVVSPLLD